ncbi:MAG: DNA polymerase III subunit delta' [Deltaproteobacteria bacterium]|nr:DNA polymerase III subunit delta' [Deltaproteobacteria bacterium]
MAKSVTKKNETPDLPDALEQARLLGGVRTFAVEQRFAGARRAMAALRPAPPQSLLLEGGTPAERANAALYWAALLNCPTGSASFCRDTASDIVFASCRVREEYTPIGKNSSSLSDDKSRHYQQTLSQTDVPVAPCLDCPVCLRYVSKLHRDMFFFDGSAESIKIDEVREMRAVLGEPPREGRLRVVIFSEGQALGEAAANALLKSLEEPKPGTVFVLTAPQRERLLPTLVSRSWTLTLPWPGSRGFEAQNCPAEAMQTPGGGAAISREDGDDVADPNPDLPVLEWAGAMLAFATNKSGRGWMERTAKRGNLDAALAMRLVLLCQTCLLEALSGNLSFNNAKTPEMSEDFSRHDLSAAFIRLAPASLHILGEALAEAQDSLNYNVNPALVLDWLATRLFFVFAGDAGR